jgi:hypothetical protein
MIVEINYNKNKNVYCPIEGPQGAKSLQWFIKKYKYKYGTYNEQI